MSKKTIPSIEDNRDKKTNTITISNYKELDKKSNSFLFCKTFL